MAKRKAARKPVRKTKQPIGWMWWTAGALCLGWLVFDANRAAIMTHMPQLASLVGEEPSPRSQKPVVKQVAKAAEPRRELRTPVESRSASEPRQSAVRNAPIPPARIELAAIAPRPAAPDATPSRRAPEAQTPRETRLMTRQATPLRREPSKGAPVWATLKAGQPLLVTESKGAWRRVESGIFTGWLEAEALSTPVSSTARLPRSQMARSQGNMPVPPQAIPGAAR